ncbi:biliverdin-producing heme oxygenase (plasmid) [Polymorphobacter sp. PAMC 29334]|uniref:biliverdin-producing heme oxygenase n=1 Tax=Polymorphobacter sp. PAMC 29334 TaxID=2862331 RepID=UPI001C774F15|nr:biliverdin-producing heme oxygenase [Polymorphobacter sp. PAMC 29334]QYE33242.1 biliverdin-producing heme oxygenase [Polymorphobacter sp. PAMC 29334]
MPRPGEQGSAIGRLREATSSFHLKVDKEYSRFDLTDRTSYGRFLLAQTQATGAAEAGLVLDQTLPAWRPRAHLLAEDLKLLGLAVPRPLRFAQEDRDGWLWGVLYVLEGSRLGGAVLVKRLSADVPSAFLSSRHRTGEWRTLVCSIDSLGAREGQVWLDAAIEGARDCFDLHVRAAASQP